MGSFQFPVLEKRKKKKRNSPVLVIKPRASCMLGKCFATELLPWPVNFFSPQCWDLNSRLIP
jgi:hypothetical protein